MNQPNTLIKRIASGLFVWCGLSLGITIAQTTVPFTSSTTWPVPAGVTSITVECWGGGGAGGGVGVTANIEQGAAGGGGRGGMYSITTLAVTPGNNLTINVGAGGTGVSGNSSGNAGGTSWVSTTGSTPWPNAAVGAWASGGSGGSGSNTSCGAGGSGYATPGDGSGTVWNGGTGGAGRRIASSNQSGGGGGGGGGTTAAGGNGGMGHTTCGSNPTQAGTGGTGGAQDGGNGGNGAYGSSTGTNAGNLGVAPGGGGGGARGKNDGGTLKSAAGGAGARGEVRITYTIASTPQYQAEITNLTPTSFCPGETKTVSITVKNTGTETWNSSINDVNFSWWGSWQSGQDANPRISPFTGLASGQSQTITFSVTAPSSGGPHSINADIVRDGHCWFRSNNGGCGPGNTDYNIPITLLAEPTAPTANTAQTFCAPATVANLATTSGTGIKWYENPNGGSQLSGTTVLTNGTTYYASQTVGTCESQNRTAVTVTLNAPAAPTANATQSFCAPATVADLATTSGTGIKWYENSNGGSQLAGTTPLTNSITYYASQTIGTCESQNRTAVTVTLNAPATPTANATQSFCAPATVADLATTSGTGIKWYENSNGGSQLAGTTPLTNSITYYASQTIGICESQNRTGVLVTVNPTVTPSVSITETSIGPYCAGANVTFSSSVTNGGNTTYQWLVNGNTTGQTTSAFTSSSLADNDAVSLAIVSDEACATTQNDTSNAITVNFLANVTPNVSITETSIGPYCAGANVTFSSTVTNGGNTTYQWLVNGNTTGQITSAFTSSSLADNDVVSLAIVSDEACATTPNDTSNAITVNFSANVTPNVSITETSTGPYCAGANVTFTSTVTNGGNTTYQWLVNGNTTGQTANTFASSSLADNDAVSLAIVSDEACATTPNDTSNTVTVNFAAAVTPNVSITETSTGPYCAGANVTFSSSVTNGGNTTYQWLVNGNTTGQTTNTFASSSLADNDVVSLAIVSDEACATTPNDTSNAITVNFSANVTPNVSITETSIGPYCAGANMTFTSTVTNGGNTTYQWLVNGNTTGQTANTFASSSLADNDVVSLAIVSDEACATTPNDTSNTVTVNFAAAVTPNVSITETSTGPYCAGANVTFSSSVTNGGNTTYQWLVNGNTTGQTANTFASSSLADNDVVSLAIVSDEACATTPNDTSNTVTVNFAAAVTPNVSITETSTGPYCSGTNVTFSSTVTNGGNTTYQWLVNGNTTGQTTNAFASSSLADNDAVSLAIVSDEACATTPNDTSNAITVNFSANVTPSVAITETSTGPYCVGASVTFSSTVTNGGNTTYQWLVNGNTTGQTTNSFASSSLADNDAVSLTIVSDEACATPANVTSNSITVHVGSSSIPAQPSVISGLSTVCAGSTNSYSVTAVAGVSYTWTLPAGWSGTSTTNSITATAGTNGGTVSVTAGNACGSSTQRTISVSSVPLTQSTVINACAPYTLNGITYTTTGTFRDTLPSFAGCDSVVVLNVIAVNPDVTATGNTLSADETGASYQWINCVNNSFLSGATQRIFTPSQAGSYAVIVNKNGCKDTSFCQDVSFVGIGEADGNTISVYPNPTSDIVYIQMAGIHGGASLSITDMAGRTVYTKNIFAAANGHTETVHIDSFNSGIYYIQVMQDGKTILGGRLVIHK